MNRTTRVLRGGSAGAVLLLAGCTGAAESTTRELMTPPSAQDLSTGETGLMDLDGSVYQACTLIGNEEHVSVDLTTVLPFEGGDYYATISVPSLGATKTTGFAGNDSYALGGLVDVDLSADPVGVEVVVVTERGDVAYRAQATATPHLSQPNGPECDGEKYAIDLRATAEGSLVPAEEGSQARDARGRTSLAVYTACGLNMIFTWTDAYARVGGVLDDGAGGPPPGWNAPFQRGWASIQGDVLTFEDERGHTEVFHRVPFEDSPNYCSS